MVPANSISLHESALIAGLREQTERLLSLWQEVLGEESTQSSRSPVDPLPKAATSPQPADLKRLILIRAKRRREPTGSFLEWPAWDMLLDLAVVGTEGGHVSVSAICVSSGAPQSTALRKLAQLERANMVQRYLHDTDRRRVCLRLTDVAIKLVNTRIAEDLLFYSELSEAFTQTKVATVAKDNIVFSDAVV